MGDSLKHPTWWQKGVIYQIYIRSFCDSNGDGIGDLQGVISKLDYLADLGIDAIWLSPVTVSANADWGYDVMDFYDIDPDLGTLDDFDELLTAAKRRNIKVVFDFVPNHTSTKHPWFLNALTGRDAKYRNYYLWSDRVHGHRPNNWRSWFGGSAWSYHASTKQYYLHNFLPQQADLNWRNPDVKVEFDRIIKFWLDRGVDGFRIDVFNMMIKDKQLRDNPKTAKGDDLELVVFGQQPLYTTSRPGVHQILKRWRAIADSYPGHRLLLGETTMTYNVKKVATYYGEQDELELAFNFNFLRARLNASELRNVVEETEDAIRLPNWPVWSGSNHDEPARLASRWAGGDERKIRAALVALLALKGTPVLYYGDEIGLQNVYVPPWRLRDPWGKKYWPIYAGRDRGRTPMAWRHRRGAGFTDPNVRPWLPYGELAHRNVATQRAKKDSTWQFARDLIALRRKHRDLSQGGYETIATVPSVWAWRRGNTTVVVNMSKFHQEMLNIHGKVVLGSDRAREGHRVSDLLHLKPWEAVIIN